MAARAGLLHPSIDPSHVDDPPAPLPGPGVSERLALAAAAVSFVQGNWFGVAWLLLAGVTSNMAYFYWKRRDSA